LDTTGPVPLMLCLSNNTKGLSPCVLTGEISQMCKESNEPIYITKNGYGDMVIMSMELYEEKMFMLDVHNKLNAAEEQIAKSKEQNH